MLRAPSRLRDIGEVKKERFPFLFPASLSLFLSLCSYKAKAQSKANSVSIICSHQHPPPQPSFTSAPITEMFLPIKAFTYHFTGDIELPVPRPPRHISEPSQSLFIPSNNLVMKY